MAIRICIYEDNQPLREAFSLLVQTTDNFELAGAFGDCLNLSQQIANLRPDVVLMDIDLPGITGIEATRQLHKQFPETEVLMLTVFDDSDQVFEAIKAGATGYLLKKTPPVRVLEAIREVYEGGAPMSPAIARRVMQSLHKSIVPNDLDQLTPREATILALLSAGNSYKMVAVEASISIDTVRTHVRRIYEKLHVHSVTEAVAKYLTR
jgi:DNA-binding NarL/FixJ family response regulator